MIGSSRKVKAAVWAKPWNLSKAYVRLYFGLIRPVRCPVCKTPTQQKKTGHRERECLVCHVRFTKGESRRGKINPSPVVVSEQPVSEPSQP